MIYTSYYGNHRNFPKNALVVSVSYHNPDGMKFHAKLTKLNPDKDLLYKFKNNEISWEEYKEKYETKISSLAFDWDKIKSDSINQDFIFLCYCKDPSICHRSIISSLFQKNGINIKEL